MRLQHPLCRQVGIAYHFQSRSLRLAFQLAHAPAQRLGVRRVPDLPPFGVQMPYLRLERLEARREFAEPLRMLLNLRGA